MLIPDFYENRPHRRLNALTGEWVLVSPHRTQRPWHGQEEEAELQILPPYDPQCYLCPGNARAGGRKNPEYKKPYVFNNDFPAMLPDTDGPDVAPADDLLSAEPEPGICRAIWPFELMILPREHGGDIAHLGTDQKRDLADAMTRLAVRYDNLFQTAFPYTMGLHQQPTEGKNRPEWHWHIHYLPPLLRSLSVKKFMVGYEMLAMPQRDLTPEACAEGLRELSEIHYLESTK